MPDHRIIRLLVLFFMLIGGLFVSSAIAQEEEQPVTTLDTIYVTDRPIIEGNRTDDYGSMKTVITDSVRGGSPGPGSQLGSA